MDNLNRLAQKTYNPNDVVFNAGVLVIDLEKWKSSGIRNKVLHWMELAVTDSFTRCCVNQPALNLAVHGIWEKLDQRWNFDPYFCDASHMEDAFIIHFAGDLKPWVKQDWDA